MINTEFVSREEQSINFDEAFAHPMQNNVEAFAAIELNRFNGAVASESKNFPIQNITE